MSAPPRLGVIVPFRDERAVLARRLANLERARWPEGARHRVVLVDDHSCDGSAEIARAFAFAPAAQACAAVAPPRAHASAAFAIEPLFAALAASARGDGSAHALDDVAAPAAIDRDAPFAVTVLEAAGARGKPAAIGRALAALGGDVDLVVLTDADVVADEGALVALADAFAREPALVLASGRQRFVRALAPDGRAPDADAARAARAWDRWTERVRALESRAGVLVNVHGQLMAWRANAGLAPTAGLAADDLDLVWQVRARGLGRVRLVHDATFYEEKPADPRRERAQALRRTRAFLQAMRARPARGPLGARWQWRLYRALPPLLLAAAIAACAALVAVGALARGLAGALVALLACVALLATAPGRAAAWRIATIARAMRVERAEPLSDHWARDRS